MGTCRLTVVTMGLKPLRRDEPVGDRIKQQHHDRFAGDMLLAFQPGAQELIGGRNNTEAMISATIR